MNRICLADDDDGLVHFLARALEKTGDRVVTFRDGPTALQAISAEPFDLIILDYKMPGLNGLETLREIRTLQVKTPVIIITASTIAAGVSLRLVNRMRLMVPTSGAVWSIFRHSATSPACLALARPAVTSTVTVAGGVCRLTCRKLDNEAAVISPTTLPDSPNARL